MTLNPRIEASAKYIHTSPHKVRRVIDQIRGCSYEQALMRLEFMPYRACEPVLRLLSSAVANASHNFGITKANLFIDTIKVDGGSLLKRFQPRARGRAFPIHKSTCHITIVMRIGS
jgi:large subunit ribosomal protein L22